MPNKPKTAKKQEFLNRSPAAQESYQLSVEELTALRDFYYQKYGITLIINGETSERAKRIQQIQDEYNKETLSPYLKNHEKYPLATYVQKHFSETDAEENYRINPYYHSAFSKYFNEIKQAIPKEFMSQDGVAIRPLKEPELERLEQCLSTLTCKKFILEKAEDYLNELKEKEASFGLPPEKAYEEIKDIQAKLGEGETVGYVFTNRITRGRKHFEVLLISKDQIIKPIQWNVPHFNQIVHSAFFNPVRPLTSTSLPKCPQADSYACGTLGLVYLKELLKDNQKQLNQFTLSFTYLDENGKALNFFFPSPQVLRYSQSSSYNEVMKKMMESSEETVTIQHKEEPETIPTIEGLLKNSLTEQNGLSQEQTEANKTLLENLPEFRKNWLNEYKAQQQLRESMANKGNFNRYLSYKTHKVSDVGFKQKLNYLKEPNSQLRQLQFITALINYHSQRSRNDEEYNRFLGIPVGFSKTDKLEAVSFLIDALQKGEPNPDLGKYKDTFRNGRLGAIIRDYAKTISPDLTERQFIENLTQEKTMYQSLIRAEKDTPKLI